MTFCLAFVVGGEALAADPPPPCDIADPTTIELKLGKRDRKRAPEVTKALRSGPGTIKPKLLFTAMDSPPKNIGIGRCVDADTARFAIRTAIDYYGGLDYLIIQNLLPTRWVLIGTTQVAELSWIAVDSGSLERLLDPRLSTDAFQDLYRLMATPTERKRPFGFEPIPMAPPDE